MKNLFVLLIVTGFFPLKLFAAPDTSRSDQSEYERGIEATVRNKLYYKKGRMEFGVVGGVMPYDTLVNHYAAGGKFHWHLTDHYGWEVVDVQTTFPSVTTYTNNLVRDKGIIDLQTSKIKLLVSTNFLLSPLYGKIRFFGSQVLYFDIYVVLGGGMANTETIKISSPSANVDGVLTVEKTGFDPMIDFGLGFKIFASSNFGIIFDLRDYVISTTTYGSRSFKSNFMVSAGASFIFPGF